MKECKDRVFKGVWIEADIWLNDNLSMTEKCLFTEINSFCNQYQSCYASNKHFADFLGISENRISHLISSLIAKGFIGRKIIYVEDGKTIKKRLLFITRGVVENNNTPIVENNNTPIVENNKENNTYINNTNINNTFNNNILSGKPDREGETISNIINYLNDVTGKNYKATTPKTRTLIKARLKEGFVLHDFKDVIDKKYKQWRGGDMEKYIRPETLFGTKFEGYLNESDVVEIPRTKKYEETPSERAMRMLNEVIGGQTE